MRTLSAMVMTAALALGPGSALARAGVTEVLAETAAWRATRTSGAPAIPAEAYLAAEAGEPQSGTAPVPGYAARKGWGVAVLEHPVETVWKSINDELSFPELTKVSKSVLLEGKAGHARRLVFHYLDVSMFDDRWWVTRVDHNASLYRASAGRLWEMLWHEDFASADLAASGLETLAEGGLPLAFTRGAWLATRLDGGRTLLEYHSHSDPGGALPAGAVSRFAASSILETFTCVDTLSDRREGKSERGFVRPDGSPLP